jgi:hypothetical protein
MEEDPSCTCAGGKFGGDSFEKNDLGMDDHFGEVSLIQCKRCRRLWLHYYYVKESFSKSGRWYHGLIPPEEEGSVTVENALEVLGKLDGYWSGGSWYHGSVVKEKGPPNLFP